MEPHTRIALSFKCPKQLNQLQPVNGDYYCDGCKKAVHDFRGMTEAQVLNVIANNTRTTCGIFEAEHINVLPQIPKWLKWASAAVLALGMTGIHERLFAQANKQPDSLAKNNVLLLGKTAVYHPAQNSSKETTTLVGAIAAGSEASFRGGENALKKYIYQHLKNPKGFTGKSIAVFTIEKDGSLSDIKIIKSAHPLFDSEIINMIQGMPKWEPQIQAGVAVRTSYTIPIICSELSK
jgi:hypothetical protein